MTTTQLAKRLGVPQSRVVAIEKGEVSGTLTLNTLYRAAEALECQVVYVLVPKQTLLSTIEARADKKAKDILAQTGHTMKLEDQETSAQELQAQYQRLVAKMLQGPPKNLWDDLE
jgi:predicted DNA-binding mobile mystery protein A